MRKWGPTKRWLPYVRYSLTFQVNQVPFNKYQSHMFWSTKIRLKLGPRKTPMDPALRDLYQALVLENAQGDLRVLLPNHDPGLSQWTRFWTRHQQTVFFVLNIFKHPVLFQDDIATLTACSFFGQRVSRVFFSRT